MSQSNMPQNRHNFMNQHSESIMLERNQTNHRNYQLQHQANDISVESYLRSVSNEKNSAMSNDRNFVKRGDLQGPVFDLDHLATFTVGSKQGLLKAEDGMRKLRIMEKSQNIWTMECQIMIDSSFLVVIDKKTGQIVEKFPLNLVHDPTSVVSDDRKDIYNNIILFTVIEENQKKNSTTPSEMHIFQCYKSHSAEIVDEIYKAKEVNQPSQTHNVKTNGHDRDDNNNNFTKSLKLASNIAGGAPTSPLNHRASFHHTNDFLAPTRIEMEVQILNHCFDDIERFVTRLQNSIEVIKELEKRQKHRKSHKKQSGDGMLNLRAQMPPTEHYVDIFQKFKHSFNLLAKLKAHIHDPNAPELVHFLFTPLSLIFNTTKEQPYRGLTKTVWNPLLTKDAKDLLLNCLTSKEQDLWLILGDAWSVTVEDARLKPQLYAHLENQVYTPVFSDGWMPSLTDTRENRNELSKIAFATAAQVQAQSRGKQSVPLQKQRNYSNTQPIDDQSSNTKYQYDSSAQSSARPSNIRNYDVMKKWAVDLCYRGAKVFEVTHDRQANNEKELTIRVGELLEVLDDKRNWWRLRNFQGQVGHAPVTILRQFEFNQSNNFMASNNTQEHGHFDADKVGYF